MAMGKKGRSASQAAASVTIRPIVPDVFPTPYAIPTTCFMSYSPGTRPCTHSAARTAPVA